MAPQRVTEKKKPDVAKNVRAVKAMVRQVEWLAWSVVWNGNRFIFKRGREEVTPDGMVLSDTQRQINKVSRYPVAAGSVLGDISQWKETTESLLERAKYFGSLGSIDFDQLKKGARSGDAKAQRKQVSILLTLLEAETSCSNNLPLSPCRTLIAIGRSASSLASEEFTQFFKFTKVSPLARALAAMAMGTADGAQFPELKDNNKETKAWLTRCFQWGKTEGRSNLDPVIIARLLEVEDGTALAREFVRLNNELVFFHLPLTQFRSLLHYGTRSDTVLTLAKQFEAMEEFSEKLLVYRHLIPVDAESGRKMRLSKQLDSERRSSMWNIRLQLVKIIHRSSSPALPTVTIGKIVRLCHDLLARYVVNKTLIDEIQRVASYAAELGPALRDDFLDILLIDHDFIWKGALIEQSDPGSDSNDTETSEPNTAETDIATADIATANITTSEQDNSVSSNPQPLEIIGNSTTNGYPPLTLIFESLKLNKNARIVRRAVLSNTIEMLRWSDLTDPDLCQKFVSWCERLKFSDWHDAKKLAELMKVTPKLAEIEPYIEGFIKGIEHAPAELRHHYFQVAYGFGQKRSTIKNDLQTSAEFLPQLIDITINDGACSCPYLVISRIALEFGRQVPNLASDLRNWLAVFYAKRAPMEHNDLDNLERGCKFAITLIRALQEGPQWHAITDDQRSKSDFRSIMEDAVSSFLLHKLNLYAQVINDGFDALAENALLARLLSDKFKSQPHRCIRFLGNLGVTKKLGGRSKEPFKAIQGYRQKERALAAIERNFSSVVATKSNAGAVDNGGGTEGLHVTAVRTVRLELYDRHSITRLSAKGWSKVAEMVPTLVPCVLSYICSRSIIKQEQEPPPAVLKVLSIKESLINEKAHLETKLEKMQRSEETSKIEQNLSIRVKNIEQRLNDESGIVAQVRKLLNKHVRHLSSDAEMCALEHVVMEVLRNHLKTIIGATAKGIVVDSFLLNALLMTQDVSSNKRLLRKLIKAHVDGDKEWRHRIAANSKFLADLKESGTQPDIWLGSHLRTVKFDGVKGNTVTIYLETDALKILEMGNYFDTCLSFGGENSFATVTNAVDLNKRVVYVFDKQGNAVGRKLIGINTDGHLIGFRTYTSIEDDALDEALRKIITNYVKEFAQRCNLKLSSVGTVEPLATKLWYDDGVETWTETENAPGSGDENPNGKKASEVRSGKNVECRKEREIRERRKEREERKEPLLNTSGRSSR